MAVSFYMNMERISLDIDNEHLNYMLNDNICENVDETIIDLEKMKTNIKNGFIIITQLNVFVESFLNTILNNCIKYDSKSLLKSSVEEKIEIIFIYYRKDVTYIKSNNYWRVFKEITKMRNEMIHFKGANINDGLYISDFSIGNICVKNFFTKEHMKYLIEQVILLGELIASHLDLKIFKDVNVFECDGRDGLVNYVYDYKQIEIDSSRFD